MTVDFKAGLKTPQDKEAIKRHPEPPARVEQPLRKPEPSGEGPSHVLGRSSTKTVQQIGLDHDKDQYELVNEAINLMFEKYGMPPMA
jgi:hypothetical protein